MSLCQPLLRRFEDPVEKLREKAITLMAELCKRVKDLQPHLPYLFPVLHHRGSPASGLDVENSVFVFDLQGYDEFKRVRLPRGRTYRSLRTDKISQQWRTSRGAALTTMRIAHCSDDEPAGEHHRSLFT